MRLKDKTALITGGTSGIGLATAKHFIREGARVAVTGLDTNRINAVRAELGEQALVMSADVRSPQEMLAVGQEILEKWGGLDVLFANAGVAYATPLLNTTESRYDEIMDTNLKGTFFTMQAIAPLLREGASVILTTSFIIHVGRPGLSLLSASKAAVRSLARTWSRELLDRQIRVNAISPGGVDTPLHGRAGGTPEQVQIIKEQISSRVPLGRIAQPEEIAAAAVFLASDESRYMLGAEIVVDGGISQI